MKRLFTLAFFPVLLSALEPVNLIKDAGFEKDSDVWGAYAKTRGGVDLDSNALCTHDSSRAYQGLYSAYSNTRIPPSPYDVDSAVISQGLTNLKEISDFDSLMLYYSIGDESAYLWLHTVFVAVHLTDPQDDDYRFGCYVFKGPDLSQPGLIPPTRKLGVYDMPTDTAWRLFSTDIQADLENAGFSNETTVDSFLLIGWGAHFPPWRGQKAFFDDIRLMGYADYDVGVKEILSGDSVWAGVDYTPAARIKNFGREAADDFLIVAEISKEEILVWADTVPYTLPADTEDTLEFGSFPVPDAASYTLTVRTFMSPDESDEDDAMSKPLYGTAISENPQSQTATLEVESFTVNPKIFYFLPQGQSGTISIYDASGRRVESRTVQGLGEVGFPSALSSGVYFVRLGAGQSSITRKAVVR